MYYSLLWIPTYKERQEVLFEIFKCELDHDLRFKILRRMQFDGFIQHVKKRTCAGCIQHLISKKYVHRLSLTCKKRTHAGCV